MDTNEFDFFHKKLNELEEASLRQEIQSLKQENVRLRALAQEKASVVSVPMDVLTLDVDELCKLLAGLNDEKSAALLLVSILKVSSGTLPVEVLKRLLQAVFSKHPDVMNIFAKGDFNVESLTNLGTLLSADKIGNLAV